MNKFASRRQFPSTFGIELEYPIVSLQTLDICPGAEILLAGQGASLPAGATLPAGASSPAGASERSIPPLALSNELVTHVIEIKNPKPTSDLGQLLPKFQKALRLISTELAPHGMGLLPGSVHPWMDPLRETRLWEHEQTEIYHAYDRIFGTHGHGWANLQSSHLNIGFRNRREFRLLHAALRLVLPLLPGLCAASPYLDGAFTGSMDARLLYYSKNQERIPFIAGDIVPETCKNPATYRRQVLARIRRDLSPFDKRRILNPEWVNSRGFIPKFSRKSFEIRVLDLQLHPQHDFFIALHILELVRLLCLVLNQDILLLARTEAFSQDILCQIYQAAVEKGSLAPLHPQLTDLLFECIDLGGGLASKPGDIHNLRTFWSQRFNDFLEPGLLGTEAAAFADSYKEMGSAAEKLFATLGDKPSRAQLAAVFREHMNKLDK